MFKRPFTKALLPAALALLSAGAAVAAPQGCPNNDVYAGNGTCITAVPLGGSAGWINDVVLLPSARFDYFEVILEPGESIVVDAFFSHAEGDINLGLRDYTNGFCSNAYLASSNSTTDNESASHTNSGSSPLLVKIQFYLADPGICTEYSFRYVVTSCPGDDFLQGNSGCGLGPDLVGFQSPLVGLTSLSSGPDFFEVTLEPGETLDLQINFLHAIADLDLFASDSTIYPCNDSLTSSESVGNQESIQVGNTYGFPMLVGIEVRFYGSNGAICAPYDLSWEITPPGCALVDPLPPTSCGNQFPLTQSLVLEDAVVEDGDADYFHLVQSPGDRWRLKIDFQHAEGDLDMAIYDLNDCDGSQVAVSQGTTNSEFLEIDADSDYIVKVYRYGGPGVCNSYDIEFLRSQPGNSIGWFLCDGLANEVCSGANLRAVGSELVADNDVQLEASSLPPNSFGFYLNSTGVGTVMPPGSVGILCINGGGIGRFIRPGEIQQSGPSGTTSLALDLASIPRPNGTVAILPGERWSFQYWYRDTASTGPVSNFSDAIFVFFE